MSRKQRRMVFIGAMAVVVTLASTLILLALRDTLVFFYAPSDVFEKKITAGSRLRLGGLVEQGSLKKQDTQTPQNSIQFTVTDGAKTLSVHYQGQLPDLFKEGQGVVAEGILMQDAQNQALYLKATTILAKHDETYMPREVAEALKKRGNWKEPAAKPAPPLEQK
jgi:cytochrome c-type biogenesis protein CcmE